ncbi:hypothetical protein Q4488_12835 [Amphritea sp. 1_MG-2023]|uniref:SPOR domain-containing protein n=1 Tax=Amphritea sp. 1_MG-2023 TaxID=3062670 RepID=UPI0026E38007|nr:SPOR domain-containing protein [Amphritea sp. 1_MG-2023]MDO6564273.1 hypothetical protein [Amphritea sp. 1_MG-2023]
MLIKPNLTRLQLYFRLPTLLGVSSTLLFASLSAASDGDQNNCYSLFAAAKYQEARPQCQELAELGDAKGAFLLATMYYQALGTKRDDQRGLFWDQVAAEKGHPESAYRLGLAYQLGQGVSQSNNQARHWYQQAALAQHPKAQKLLGSMFETGAAGEKDEQRAYQWYLKAAQQDVMEAQLKIGTMLLEGRGVKANRASAQHWIRKAAEAGNANAQVAMGVFLAEVDPDESLNWYQRSAAQGNGLALQNLALVYYVGQGVDTDHAKAADLAQQALDAGNKEAGSLLNLIRLETEQKKVVELQAEKQQLARQIRESIPDNGSGERQLLLATLSVDKGMIDSDDLGAQAEPMTDSVAMNEVVESAAEPLEPSADSSSEPSADSLSEPSTDPLSKSSANSSLAPSVDAASKPSAAALASAIVAQDASSSEVNVATNPQQAPWQPDNQYALPDGWVMDKFPPNFTIQLLYGTDEQGVLNYINKHQLPETVRYFRTQREAGLFFVLVYGDYKTIAEANAALAELSESAQKSHWIRKFRRLQELYVDP